MSKEIDSKAPAKFGIHTNPTLKWYLANRDEDTDNFLELRSSGASPTYGVSFVYHKIDTDTDIFYNIIDHEGNFLLAAKENIEDLNTHLPISVKIWQLESGGDSNTLTYKDCCIIFISRGIEYGVYMCDNWNSVAKIHEVPNIAVSVSNHTVTVTNNRSSGAINVIALISRGQTY